MTVKCFNFSVALLVCCLQGLSIHNAEIGLVETLKYKMHLVESQTTAIELYLPSSMSTGNRVSGSSI